MMVGGIEAGIGYVGYPSMNGTSLQGLSGADEQDEGSSTVFDLNPFDLNPFEKVAGSSAGSAPFR